MFTFSTMIVSCQCKIASLQIDLHTNCFTFMVILTTNVLDDSLRISFWFFVFSWFLSQKMSNRPNWFGKGGGEKSYANFLVASQTEITYLCISIFGRHLLEKTKWKKIQYLKYLNRKWAVSEVSWLIFVYLLAAVCLRLN